MVKQQNRLNNKPDSGCLPCCHQTFKCQRVYFSLQTPEVGSSPTFKTSGGFYNFVQPDYGILNRRRDSAEERSVTIGLYQYGDLYFRRYSYTFHFTTKSLSGILKDISERFVIDGKIFLFAVDGQGIILQNIFALTMKLMPVSLSRRPLVDESMLKCRRSWVVVVCLVL